MRTSDWNRLARDIQSNYESFDGFVILHGTDTMAYTSSALAFQLPQLGKPVILTGSQLPLGEIRNDARENLITAILLAADCGIPEVCILFGDSLLRGCRATKWSATRFDAFDSPNYPPLATIGTNIDIHRRRVRATPDHAQSMPVLSIDPQEITTFRLFPGIAVDVLQNVLRRPLRALILESFGDGNGPTNHPQFIDSIREACDGGTVILNCSQCRHGRISQSIYETGTVLDRAGVVSGHDLTIEAAVTKLMYLFTQHSSVETIKQQLQSDLVGEMTV